MQSISLVCNAVDNGKVTNYTRKWRGWIVNRTQCISLVYGNTAWCEETWQASVVARDIEAPYVGALENRCAGQTYSSRGRTDKKLTSTLVIRNFLSFELADIFKSMRVF